MRHPNTKEKPVIIVSGHQNLTKMGRYQVAFQRDLAELVEQMPPVDFAERLKNALSL